MLTKLQEGFVPKIVLKYFLEKKRNVKMNEERYIFNIWI